MLQHVEIQNFRGLGYFSLPENLSPITVLLGPNSCGKTTVLHAVRMACHAVELAISLGNTISINKDGVIILANGALIESPSQLLPLVDWQALFLDQKVSEGTFFSINLKFSDDNVIQNIHLYVRHARNRQLKFSVYVTSPKAVALTGQMKRNETNAFLIDWLRDHAVFAVFIPPFYGVVREEELRPRIVVNRLVGSGDQSHVVRNLIATLEPHQFSQLNAFLDEVLGARIVYRTSGDRFEIESPLRVEFSDNNGPIEVSAAGAGFVNLIALYASLAHWQKTAKSNQVIFLLDEPEAHLHPRLQAMTARRIASLLTEEFGAQLFMATHSVDIINSLGESPDCKLIRVDRKDFPSVTVLDGQKQILADLAEWVDLSPFTSINFMASPYLLFHEGPSDGLILGRCADLLFRQKRQDRAHFERWSLQILDGCGNHKVVDTLTKLLEGDVVHQAQKPDFTTALILDRDYQRKPGFIIEHHTAKKTWSLHSIESLFVSDVLIYWIKAYAGEETPDNIADLVGQAISEADKDVALNDYAAGQLFLELSKLPQKDKNGNDLTFNSDGHKLAALKQAQMECRNDPARFQRGKDRANFVLNHIRPYIGPTKRQQFPGKLELLIKRVDLNAMPNPITAIPEEIRELLTWMVARSSGQDVFR